MQVTRIEFNGYERLARTSCNVDGKLIAFVGPNEARRLTEILKPWGEAGTADTRTTTGS